MLTNVIDREVAANAASNRHNFLVSLEHALKRQAVESRQAESEHAAAELEAEQPAEEDPPVPSLRVAGE